MASVTASGKARHCLGCSADHGPVDDIRKFVLDLVLRVLDLVHLEGWRYLQSVRNFPALAARAMTEEIDPACSPARARMLAAAVALGHPVQVGGFDASLPAVTPVTEVVDIGHRLHKYLLLTTRVFAPQVRR